MKTIGPFRSESRPKSPTDGRSELARALAAAVGPHARLIDDPTQLRVYSYDSSFEAMLAPRAPDVVLLPRDAEDVARAVRFARAQKIPVTPRGASTGQTGGALAIRGGIVVDMTQLDRVIEVDPENLQVITEPGIVHANLNTHLATYRLIFPPDPGSSRMCTVGGMVSNNSRGMRACKYGSTGDYVLGLDVVLPDGELITTGSIDSRALQSSSGMELTKLFVGAEGMLGIITRLRLRLIPKPRTRGIVMGQFAELEKAGESVVRVFQAGIVPAAIEILDGSAVRAVNLYRPQLQLPNAEAILLFEVDGNPPGVAFDAAQIADTIRPLAIGADWSDDPKRVEALWEARSVVGAAFGQLRPGGTRAYTGEDICVPLNRVPEALRAIQNNATELDLVVVTYGHIASGNLHPALVVNMNDPEEIRRVRIFADRIHKMARQMRGTVTGEHGVGFARIPYMREEHGPALDVMWRLKRALDPDNLMNPGKLFPAEMEERARI